MPKIVTAKYGERDQLGPRMSSVQDTLCSGRSVIDQWTVKNMFGSSLLGENVGARKYSLGIINKLVDTKDMRVENVYTMRRKGLKDNLGL